MRIVVVGAGMAGLTCADALAAAGHEVEVLERSRGTGGRTASRRVDGLEFDLGAPCFFARGEDLRAAVATWCEEGVVRSWEPRVAALEGGARLEVVAPEQRWVGVPRMSALTRHLARRVRLHTGVEVQSLQPSPHGIRVLAEDGREHGRADAVVIAVPPLQAVPLLEAVPELAWTASQQRTLPIWVVLLAFAGPLDPGFDLGYVYQAPLAVVVRGGSKPGRGSAECWTVHATADWSARHLEDAPASVIESLGDELALALGRDLPRPVLSAAHCWRSAAPTNPLDRDAFWDGSQNLGVCGDWCGGNMIEDAWRSGRALAARMLADAAG